MRSNWALTGYVVLGVPAHSRATSGPHVLNIFSSRKRYWVGIWSMAKPPIIETVFETTIVLEILTSGHAQSQQASV
jgi:hypothetical protein